MTLHLAHSAEVLSQLRNKQLILIQGLLLLLLVFVWLLWRNVKMSTRLAAGGEMFSKKAFLTVEAFQGILLLLLLLLLL